MRERPMAVARTAGTGLLWLGGAALFFAVLATSVSEGAGSLALMLMLASVAGVVVLLRPEWGVLTLTSTFFLSYPAALQGAGKLTINNVLGLVLAAVLLVRIVVDRRIDFLSTRQVRWLLVIGFVVLVNHVFVETAPPMIRLEHLDLTDERFHDLISKLAYVTFIVAFIRKGWQVTVLASAIVFFVLITAPNAIWNAVSLWNQPLLRDVETIRAAADVGIVAARNANRLAFVSCIGIALIGFAMREFPSRLLRLLGLVAIPLLVVTVFLSASRSGLLNLLLLAGVFVAGLRIRLRSFLAGSLVAAAGLALVLSLVPPDVVSTVLGGDTVIQKRIDDVARQTSIPQAYLQRITNFFLPQHADTGVAESTQSRLELLRIAWRMVLDHPIAGVGFGDYRWVSILEYRNPRESALHNSYMLALVEGGLLLLIPYLMLFRVTWKDLGVVRERAAARPDLRLGWLADGLRMTLVMFLVFSVFADVWHEVFLFLIVGLAAVLVRLHAEGEPA